MKDKIGYIIGTLLLVAFFVWMALDYNQRINSIQEFSKNMFYMDTYISVKIYTKDKVKAKEALDSIDKIYETYNNLTDRYNSYDGTNNIYKINNNTLTDEKLTIDEKLYDLIFYGIDMYEETNGLININLGHVIDVWKSYRESESGVPTYEELKNSGSIDINDIQLLDNNQILNNHPCIDLGSIAKGYTNQIVADYLKSIGLNSFLINAGGSVVVGEHYANDTYKIGIETPTSEGGVYDVVSFNNKSLTTSGNYQRYYIYDKVLYHHIIDPNTLFPPNYFRSVSVITNNAALGDMLSTTLFLMTIEDGKTYLKENYPDVEAVWYTNDDEIERTEGFSNYE
ncbi:MAG: FAD:protein FMN transferase [Bacilli bacterium]|nr:FAD:protein FMN transferase [Bacilli bacterium]